MSRDSDWDDATFGEKVFIVISALLLIGIPILGIYMQVIYWGPQEQAAKAARDRAEAVQAEARRIEVKNAMMPKPEQVAKPFTAEFRGEFNGGFQNHIRQIFVLTDTETGRKYLTVTGCGTCELSQESYSVRERDKPVTKTRTVEE